MEKLQKNYKSAKKNVIYLLESTTRLFMLTNTGKYLVVTLDAKKQQKQLGIIF